MTCRVVALDAPPIISDQRRAFERNSQVYFSAHSRPLIECSSESAHAAGAKPLCTYSHSPDGLKHILTPGHASLSQAIGRHVAEVIKLNTHLGKIYFKNLIEIGSRDGCVSLVFTEPDFRVAEFLRQVPFWWKDKSTDEGATSSNVRFVIVKCPSENLLMYRNGLLDETSDTAFPLDQINNFREHPDFRLCDSGVQMRIIFGQRFHDDPELRKKIAETVRVSVGKRHISNDPFSPLSRKLEGIRVTFDDFYPNQTMARVVSRSLGLGDAVCSDSYQEPSSAYDLRIVLSSGFASGAFGRLGELALDPCVFASGASHRKLVDSLSAFQRGEIPAEELENLERTMEFDESLFVKLTDIPAAQMVRQSSANDAEKLSEAKEPAIHSVVQRDHNFDLNRVSGVLV